MHFELLDQIQNIDSIRQALSSNGTTAAPPTEQAISIWSLIRYAGWAIMGPLALMSLLTVYILIERVMAIRSAQRLDPDFMNKVRDYVHEGKLDSAKNLCANSRSPIARMIEKGISRIGSPTRDIEHAMESVGKLEIAQMERGVGMLSLFAKLAPLFGFIGTIVGVIKIFYEIALADNISIGIIAEGLYQKMVSSASGLIVGIVAFTGYWVISTLVDRLAIKMDRTGQQFLDLLQEPQKG